MSRAPDLVQDADQDQHQSARDNYDDLLTIVPDSGPVVFNVWIAIEKLMSPAKNENAAKEKGDGRESECDGQHRNASLFNHRHQQGNIRPHNKYYRRFRSVAAMHS
jgi:hypothetical protein